MDPDTYETSETTDIIQVQFYKNPVFLVFFMYSMFMFITYASMSDDTKNSYVFNDKFRNDMGIRWKDMITYPYDTSKSVSSFLAGYFIAPIVWYVLVYSSLVTSFVDVSQAKSYQAYFYSVMFSYLVLVILFTIHVIIFNFVDHPKQSDIELDIGDPDMVDVSYEGFYRTQWILLLFLSPIFVSLVVYVLRRIYLT
jgi:hypothetical protein